VHQQKFVFETFYPQAIQLLESVYWRLALLYKKLYAVLIEKQVKSEVILDLSCYSQIASYFMQKILSQDIGKVLFNVLIQSKTFHYILLVVVGKEEYHWLIGDSRFLS